MNFVRFMHEVVAAIEEGYTLTLEPQHAPVGYPNYSVTLVLEDEVALSEDEKAVLEEVKAEQKDSEDVSKETIKEPVKEPTEEAPKKAQGRQTRK